MEFDSIYRTRKKIVDNKYFSCYVYYMRPRCIEEKHYHDAIELEIVLSGNCKTHKRGRLYIYRRKQIHEVINDSDEELVFVCLTIPPESDENTHYESNT